MSEAPTTSDSGLRELGYYRYIYNFACMYTLIFPSYEVSFVIITTNPGGVSKNEERGRRPRGIGGVDSSLPVSFHFYRLSRTSHHQHILNQKEKKVHSDPI